MKDDETRRGERAEQVALFRYGLISDLIHPAAGDERRRLYERLREKAAKSYCIPGTRRTRVAVETLRDWLSDYKAGGFDALRPKPRADIGMARGIPQPLCDLLVMLKDEHRDWSVATVIETAKQMDEQAAAMVLPVSTVHRLLSRAGVMGKRPEDPTAKDRRRFAYAQAGELWMSDVMHGPAVVVGGRRKQKTYLIGLLDDATRARPLRGLRPVGERERVSARAQAGGHASRHPAAAVRRQWRGVPLAPSVAGVRAPGRHAHPRAP